jgi:hypothetical protein
MNHCTLFFVLNDFYLICYQELLDLRSKDLKALGDASPLQSKSARSVYYCACKSANLFVYLQIATYFHEGLGCLMKNVSLRLMSFQLRGQPADPVISFAEAPFCCSCSVTIQRGWVPCWMEGMWSCQPGS